MHAWQVATLVIVLGILQIWLALVYLQPKSKLSQYSAKYNLWKPLLVIAVVITLTGFVLLCLPSSIWWSS